MLPGLVGICGFSGSGNAGVDNAASAPTFGAVGTHTTDSIVAAYPTGISANDLLEITVYTVGGDGTAVYSAAGWTAGPAAMTTGTGGINVFQITTLYKIATGSESGSTTVTLSGGTAPGRHFAVCKRYSGVNTSSPYEGTVDVYTANTNGVGATSATVTTLGTGRLIINQWLGNPTSLQTWNVGSGWTSDYAFSRFALGPDYQTYQAHNTASGTGAQSAESMTTTMTGDDIYCMSYAIKGTPS